jgi:hypothetical protein
MALPEERNSTMSREAMKLALEALEALSRIEPGCYNAAYVAIAAIREALAQPEQEPVAWESLLGAVARGWCYEKNANKTMDVDLAVAIAKEVDALYTTPPHRKPLTDEEAKKIFADEHCNISADLAGILARAIEAAHGIKGEA